ncbi:hypothetical protein BCV72DRAFT_250474 [Rhizopus microsporus var. microsporus]|uniref:Uncharacterized protein n=1 Tax=Rhizopus microsporus var. microsporus TaxID=86635 RepID=A0A1X0R0R4_RHIZD|nr:hypothetical protein BCV72DRAFT_250474 [Rhizopus microsporus var. microsporus]
MYKQERFNIESSIDDSYHNVFNCEFANDKLGPRKLTIDHLKVLRESKGILGDMIIQEFMQAKDARRLIIPSFEANSLEGETKLTKPVASGLYTVRHFVSVDIPYLVHDLSVLRVKPIPRLKFMKYHSIKDDHLLHGAIKRERKLKKKKKSSSYRRSPSNDNDIAETETNWTRRTWFPSLKIGSSINIPFDLCSIITITPHP